ncbi:MAG: energy transducer TonB [Candidatus Methylumidiphilus sp.]
MQTKPAETEDVPEFKDDFSELSKGFADDPDSSADKISLDSKPQGYDNTPHNGSIISAKPMPIFPIHAMRGGAHGTVVVLIHIAPDGKVNSVDLFKSSGYEALDNEVLGAVQHWIFKPPMRGNTPVEGTLKFTMIYHGEGDFDYDGFDTNWRDVQIRPAE